MSRSNQTVSASPVIRWLEWTGDLKNADHLRYYDKADKHNVGVPMPCQMLLLDELASVRGWSELHQAGIYSNEVRSTTTEEFVVRAHGDARPLARGLYKDIRADVQAAGGRYHASLYVYGEVGGDAGIHNLKLRGAALAAWMEFRRQARGAVYERALSITVGPEQKKGSVRYVVPAFALADVTPAQAAAAVAADRELQAYLTEYFARDSEAGNAAVQGSPRPAGASRGAQDLAALAGTAPAATAAATSGGDDEFDDEIPF